MNVAIYARVSTPRQQQAQTIDQQLERLRAHVVAQTDWHLDEEHIYRDDGYSGAQLNRPGLDRLRDHAAFAAFELVLITAPDRLARSYVHQVVLIDELAKHGCSVMFLDRPMSTDPHDQLLLHIRGAVAEYERTLIGDRMRRGRQAKLRSGQLLPWTVPPYGYILDGERPRDPHTVRVDPVQAAIVAQIFAWFTDPQQPATLQWVARQLTTQGVPAPKGGRRWSRSSIRSILRDPAYIGTTYSGRTRTVRSARRKSPLRPMGPGYSQQPAPSEGWIAIAVPAIIDQATFDAAQVRLEQNKQLAKRHNTTHNYLLRGLVWCGHCQRFCHGRTDHLGYSYYLCCGRLERLKPEATAHCTARYIPVADLDALVWQDLCVVLREPTLITHELEQARAGEWLPQALRARQKTVNDALAQLERQQARLLDLYLSDVIERAVFERKHHDLSAQQEGLRQQQRQLAAQAQQHLDVVKLTDSITAFCTRLQATLDQLDFAQQRQLVELLIDCVIVSDEQVEIRYVIPTGPQGETTIFRHLRSDYLHAGAIIGEVMGFSVLR
jgi:site-specific DNA recombinase